MNARAEYRTRNLRSVETLEPHAAKCSGPGEQVAPKRDLIERHFNRLAFGLGTKKRLSVGKSFRIEPKLLPDFAFRCDDQPLSLSKVESFLKPSPSSLP